MTVVFWVAWPLCTMVSVALIWDWWRHPDPGNDEERPAHPEG